MMAMMVSFVGAFKSELFKVFMHTHALLRTSLFGGVFAGVIFRAIHFDYLGGGLLHFELLVSLRVLLDSFLEGLLVFFC